MFSLIVKRLCRAKLSPGIYDIKTLDLLMHSLLSSFAELVQTIPSKKKRPTNF